MSDGQKPKPQHAPKAPHEDPIFLQSTPARPIRILGEYIHPLVQLKREEIGDTIVMFGSARIESQETAEARCTRLKNEKTSKMPAAKLAKHRAALRHAKRLLEMSRYYEEARQLSHKLTNFFMRKLWFAQIAKALIVFPGGFGTMDELWEMLTLLQTGKLPKQNIILIYGRKYWDEVLNWKAMVRWGTINEDEYKMLQLPTPWTKPLTTSARGSRNTTWSPTPFYGPSDPPTIAKGQSEAPRMAGPQTPF